MNGSEAPKLDEAVQSIDRRLLLTRTAIGLVQDLLRDSITDVVNRVAADYIAEYPHEINDALAGNEAKGRMARYQFYQHEVLRRLGYDFPSDHQWHTVAFRPTAGLLSYKVSPTTTPS